MGKARLERRRPPFTVVGNGIIEDSQVTRESLLVYLVLCYHADRAARAFPSYTTIAREARISRRSAITAVKLLVQAKYVEKNERPAGKGHAANLYVIRDMYLHVPLMGGAPDTPSSAGDALGGERGAPGVVHESTSNKNHITRPKNKTAAPSAPPPKKQKVPDGYQQFVAELFHLHQEATGDNYVFDKQHGRMVKDVLKKLGHETAVGKLQSYYRGQHWFTRDGKYSLEGFIGHINEVSSVAASEANKTPEQAARELMG